MYENNNLTLDWDSLRLVLKIDRHGGVSGAARALGVTHATVSRRLAAAEADAGMRFFDRLPAGLRLTAAGKVALDHAAQIEASVNGLERLLIGQADTISGPLRVTLPPLMMTRTLARVFGAFAKKHPGVALEFVGDNDLLNLHQRQADIAIRVTRKPPETLWGRKLTDQDAAYYANTDWLAKGPFGQGDIADEVPLISFASWPSPIPKQLAAICSNIRVVARSDDMMTAINLVREGLGITRMPKVVGDAADDLTRITALPKQAYAPIWLLAHPELKDAPAIKAFVREMKLPKSQYIFAGE